MRRLAVVLLAGVVAVALNAAQAASFKCGKGLVKRGDRESKVLSKCGEPLFVRATYDLDGKQAFHWYYPAGRTKRDPAKVLELQEGVLKRGRKLENMRFECAVLQVVPRRRYALLPGQSRADVLSRCGPPIRAQSIITADNKQVELWFYRNHFEQARTMIFVGGVLFFIEKPSHRER